MTTDELLAKLQAEYNLLESDLPEIFTKLGREAYYYPDSKHFHYTWEIKHRIERQEEIRAFQAKIQREVER